MLDLSPGWMEVFGLLIIACCLLLLGMAFTFGKCVNDGEFVLFSIVFFAAAVELLILCFRGEIMAAVALAVFVMFTMLTGGLLGLFFRRKIFVRKKKMKPVCSSLLPVAG